MNSALFFQRHKSLLSIAGLLILALILVTIKNQRQTPVAEPAITPASVVTRPSVKPPIAVAPAPSEPRAVSSANAAASLSHAIESSLRPDVMPLPDFAAMLDVKTKKMAFFDYLQGLSQTANSKIKQLRAEIKRMNPQRLTQLQTQRLSRLSKTHKIKTTDPQQQISLLLRKIERVPAALVLAQAANESAWGTSRFATQGNNLFGQWCFSKGCGLIPSGRPTGETYEVRKFKDPQASVDAYIRNLNSHASYIVLRRIRECLINNKQTVSGRALSAGLIGYSSRGVDYINDIRGLIRVNKLEPWHTSWWGNDRLHPCSELVQLPQAEPDAPIDTKEL